MPPKRKRQKRAAAENSEEGKDNCEGKETSESFLTNSREAVIKTLKTEADRLDEEDDFERLVTSVRALIDTNKEIWERVLQNKAESTSNISDGKLSFYRFGYSSVQANFQATNQRNSFYTFSYSQRRLLFQTSPELEVNKFPKFPSIPQVLKDIFIFNDNKDDFPDYEPYLGKVSLLQKDVSGPFITILKEHLKDIQVALGKIESWLLEPNHALEFINENFHKELSAPQLAAASKNSTDTNKAKEGDICVKCFQTKRAHRNDYHHCPTQSNMSYYNQQTGAYVVSQLQTIRSVVLSSLWQGQITRTFQIGSDQEKERLKKFIAFMDEEERKEG